MILFCYPTRMFFLCHVEMSPYLPLILSSPHHLVDLSLRELRQIAWTLDRLAASLTIADNTVQLQQVRFHPVPSYTIGEPHSHSCYEAILVLDGAVAYPTCDPPTLQVGDACLFPPGMRHAWQTDAASCLRLVCWFTCARTMPLLSPISASCPDYVFFPSVV